MRQNPTLLIIADESGYFEGELLTASGTASVGAYKGSERVVVNIPRGNSGIAECGAVLTPRQARSLARQLVKAAKKAKAAA